MSCSICLEDFDDTPGNQPYPLECEHKACKKCMADYLRHQNLPAKTDACCFFYRCPVKISARRVKRLIGNGRKGTSPVPARAEDEDRNERLLEEYAASVGAVRCPRCRIFVERVGGCRYVKCLCGRTFVHRGGIVGPVPAYDNRRIVLLTMTWTLLLIQFLANIYEVNALNWGNSKDLYACAMYSALNIASTFSWSYLRLSSDSYFLVQVIQMLLFAYINPKEHRLGLVVNTTVSIVVFGLNILNMTILRIEDER